MSIYFNLFEYIGNKSDEEAVISHLALRNVPGVDFREMG